MALKRSNLSVTERTGFSQWWGVEIIEKKVATCLLNIRSFWGPTELLLSALEIAQVFAGGRYVWLSTRLAASNYPYPCAMLLQLEVTATVLIKPPRAGSDTCSRRAWVWYTSRHDASCFLERYTCRRDVLRIWHICRGNKVIQLLQGTTEVVLNCIRMETMHGIQFQVDTN